MTETLSTILLILKNWWWVLPPLPFFFLLQYYYLYWVRWEVWYKAQKWILLEIKPPKEILKPLSAMEDIFTVLWGIIDTAVWRERWCEGQLICGPYWVSLEIVSIGGKIHLFIRCFQEHRNLIESTIYAHYSDVEISLVDDYTKNIPQDIPNDNWDFYGEEYRFLRDNAYPIRTYPIFFEPSGERITQEEKRIDPLNSFLEAMTKLQLGEQFWFQICAAPISDKNLPWQTQGRQLADKLAKRPSKPRQKSMIEEALDVLISGKSTEPSPEKEIYPPEMRLTPGEKEELTAVEKKISKLGFKTWIRGLYVAKRDTWNVFNRILARQYLTHFSGSGLNAMVYFTKTRAKIHYFFKKRRLYLRKRSLLRNYINRVPPLFPKRWKRAKDGIFILNTEELATIYHFPTEVIVPTLPYVEAKKAGPPPQLPTE